MTAPLFTRCVLEPRDGEPGYVTVWFHWAGVDRPVTHGIVARKAVAPRLVRAAQAGAIFVDPHVATDTYGQTYVEARCRVMGKYLNSDLRKLGY